MKLQGISSSIPISSAKCLEYRNIQSSSAMSSMEDTMYFIDILLLTIIYSHTTELSILSLWH